MGGAAAALGGGISGGSSREKGKPVRNGLGWEDAGRWVGVTFELWLKAMSYEGARPLKRSVGDKMRGC